MADEILKLKELISSYINEENVLPPDVPQIHEQCRKVTTKARITLIKQLNICLLDKIRRQRECKGFNDRRTCIHLAAERGDTDLIDTLIDGVTEEEKFNLLTMDPVYNPYNSVVEIAVRNANASWVQKTLKQFSKEGHLIEIIGKALVTACQKNDHEVVKWLLDAIPKGKKLAVLTTYKMGSYYCLHLAAVRGFSLVVKELLGSMSEEAGDDAVLSLLHYRTRSPNFDRTALHLACGACGEPHSHTVGCLLEGLSQSSISNLLQQKDEDGNTALHHAVKDGSPDLVRTLGLDKLSLESEHLIREIINKKGKSAYDVAYDKGNMWAVRYFQEINSEAAEKLPLSEQIDRLTVQRDKLDDQISQLMIQQQREQEQSQHKDVKLKPDAIGVTENERQKITTSDIMLHNNQKLGASVTALQMNITATETSDDNQLRKYHTSDKDLECSNLSSDVSNINQLSAQKDDSSEVNIPSPNIDSDSAAHSDVVGRAATTPAEEITPLRGPESIPEHQGEAKVAAALSADMTTLNPESAQDDVSSDVV